MVIIDKTLKYDNCKNCASRCEHAGKDREFIIRGEKSCKVMASNDTKIFSKNDIINIIDKAIKEALQNKNDFIKLNGYTHKDVLNCHDTKISTLSTLYHYFDC